MAEFLRLKQICLVAPHLEPFAADIGTVMGLDICYRDEAVGNYGLENVLFPVDSILLEVVAPTRDGTAAGRYLDRIKRADVKEGFHGGYMVIFTASDVERRRENAKSIGVRVAHVLDMGFQRRGVARLPGGMDEAVLQVAVDRVFGDETAHQRLRLLGERPEPPRLRPAEGRAGDDAPLSAP